MPETREQVMQALGSQTLMFIENLGQFQAQDLDGDGQPDAGAAPRFLLSGATGGNTWLADDGIWITLAEAPALDNDHARMAGDDAQIKNPQSKIQNLKLSFPGRNPQARLEASGRLEVSFNYFLGNDKTKWVANAPVYAAARYTELYPGVDLEVRVEGGGWQGVFVEKRPGALRTAQPALRVEGAEGVRLDAPAGQIVVATMLGERSLPLFRAETVTGRALAAGHLPAAQMRGDTIIVPVMAGQSAHTSSGMNTIQATQYTGNPYSGLAYSTFLGGSANETGFAIALDGSENAYVTGRTASNNFPTTAGAYDTTNDGGTWDIFVTKLNADGSALVYSTFLGGSNTDESSDIALDSSGNAYVTGFTTSSNFPTTAGAYDTTYNGGNDAFVTKLNAAGSALVYSTFLGESNVDNGRRIALDSSGNAYVTGLTTSSNFPTTAGAYDTTYNGANDVFVTKLNAAGSALVYSTFLGGGGSEDAYSITLDENENIYITGRTRATNFPTTAGAYDTTHNGDLDVFVTKLNAAGSALVYSTFLGGSNADESRGIALDSSGNAYVTGFTNSSNFPTTAGAHDETHNGGNDVFVTKLNAAGSALVYSTFLGGSNADQSEDIALDSSGNAYVTGLTTSFDFPTTAGAHDETHNGSNDIFVTELNATGSALVYSTFLGGGGSDRGFGITLDGSGNIYVTGGAGGMSFPTTPGAFDRLPLPEDVFVTKLVTTPLPPGPFSKSGPANAATGQPISLTLSWTAPLTGTPVDHYRYCLSPFPNCEALTPTLPGEPFSATVSGLLPGTTYYWQARACADANCFVFTDANHWTQWSFMTVAQPGAFSKSTPSNGATNQSINPTLSWGIPSGTVNHYRYCYSTSSGCVPTINSGTNTVVALSGLTPGTTYYWQARACADVNCTVFRDANGGSQWIFATSSGPNNFSKLSPASGASGLSLNPSLTWQSTSGQGTVTYSYCVKTVDAACAGSEWTDTGLNTTSGPLSLSPATTYYWQARACDLNGCTEANTGSRWNFSTAGAVGSFNKLVPANGALNVNTVTAQLQWVAASAATQYKVCVGTAVNSCDVVGGGPGVYSSTGTSLSLALSGLGLQPNTTYYWQALATNGIFTTFANGNALAFWSFTTPGGAVFSKIGPAFNTTNVPTQNVSFTWQPASGAVSYTVCVGAFAGDCSYSVTSTATSSVLAGPLPAGATLVWQVTAHYTGGSVSGANNGAWWPFTTVPNAPAAFSKLSPASGATGQAIGVSLVWQDAVGETYYHVCVGTAIGLCNMANVTTTANTTSFDLTGLDYATTYWWQISACNTGGCAPANGGVSWSFTTQNPPLPGAFQKTSPLNGTINVPTNTSAVLLQWTSAANADGYEVCFGTQPNTCDLSGGGFQDVGNANSRLLSQLPFSVTLQPASTYWWQVRALNFQTATRMLADGGVDFFFTTLSVAGPGGFSKDAPVNGTFNLPTASVTLRWFPASGATSYEVCVGTAANSCDALPGNAWQNVGNVLQTPIVNLNPGTTYFWQVRAVNTGGMTAANGGAWWQFTTRNANPPAEFSKVSPFHLATGVPTATAMLSWNASTGATGYEVCVGSAPGLCEASGGWVNVGNVTSWTPPALGSAMTYWWQVRALGGSFSVQANGGQWWAFTTVADPPPAPAAFSKLTPVQGASEVTVSATLTWQSASSATSYQVCVGTQAGLCDVTGSWVNAGNVTVWNAPALSPATTYWWQVRAVNAGGQTQANNGAWWYFTTAAAAGAPGAFSKSAPDNAAADQPVNPTLSWTAASGATGYRVCVGMLPGDCSATGGWVNASGLSHALSGLAYDTTYWWQVRAVNANGQTFANGGVWWRFTTGNDPGSPLEVFGKTAPANQATGVLTNTTLSWGASSGATHYGVCVGTQPGLCDVMNNVEVLSPTTSLALANAQAGQTYWWQVTAYGSGQYHLADAGQWWAFTTANDTTTGPGDFQKTSPLSGTVIGTGPTLAWTLSSGAVGYRLCVGTAWGLCDVVNNVATTSLSQTLSGLPPGSYWWQVMALDANGNTTQADNGARWQFTVQDDGIGNLNTSGPTGTRKEVTPTAVRMGEAVTYTIVLSNSSVVAVTVWVTDTLAVSATLLSATPGYAQSGQTLVWSNVVVPAGGTATITITVRAGSGPLPFGYTLSNDVHIGAHDGEISRNAPPVQVRPWEAFVPIVTRGN